jgi:hypothetical protein
VSTSDTEILDLAQLHTDSFLFGIRDGIEYIGDRKIPHTNHAMAIKEAGRFALDDRMDAEMGASRDEAKAIRIGAEVAAKQVLKSQIEVANV